MSHVTEITGAAPHHGTPKAGVLMVAANPATSEQTGWPVGCWAAELTHPFHELTRAGYEVTLASPDGGVIEFDAYSDPTHESGYSAHDLLTLGFMNRPDLMERTRTTTKLSEIDPARFEAIYLVGGQSPMVTFRGNEDLMRLFATFHDGGKPVAAVCHATCILLDTRRADGALLVAGKRWTGFANSEEEYADEAVGQRLQPFWIENEARELDGTEFVVKPAFTEFAVRDGNLITGQQQFSGAAVAKLLVAALAEYA